MDKFESWTIADLTPQVRWRAMITRPRFISQNRRTPSSNTLFSCRGGSVVVSSRVSNAPRTAAAHDEPKFAGPRAVSDKTPRLFRRRMAMVCRSTNTSSCLVSSTSDASSASLFLCGYCASRHDNIIWPCPRNTTLHMITVATSALVSAPPAVVTWSYGTPGSCAASCCIQPIECRWRRSSRSLVINDPSTIGRIRVIANR
jgi:hypothetical protein